MKLSKAIKRLGFTISKSNKPNETDILAYNKLIEFLQLQQKKEIEQNLLFAKLYTFVLTQFLNYYNEVDFANNELNKIISEPLELRINILMQKLNNLDIQNYFLQKEILDPLLKNKTNKELIEIHERYIDKLPVLNKKDFKNSLENWDFERVKYFLEANINLSIQKYKNKI
jgi:hypothetical protein